MAKAVRRSQAEIVAFHLGWDIKDIRELIYQPTRYVRTKVYTAGPTDYICAAKGQPKDLAFKDYTWSPVGEYYGWTVYTGKAEST